MIEQALTRDEALLPAMETLTSIPASARHRIAAVLSERGETTDCLPQLRRLLDHISIDELITALSCGVGWERVCQPAGAEDDCNEPVHQHVLAVLHAHGGSVSWEELERRVSREALPGIREQLEHEGWLRVLRSGESSGNRWIVPLQAAGVAAHAWQRHQATQPLQWPEAATRIGLQDYRSNYRSMMRRLEQAPRRDSAATRLLLDVYPAALASGDSWTVANLARRHLGGHGPQERDLAVATARLMWTAGLPELARVTLRLSAAQRGSGMAEAITEVLVDAAGAGQRRLETILDLARRCVADDSDASPITLAVLDASVEATLNDHFGLARDLTQAAYELALGSGKDHLTARCCLVEALQQLKRGDFTSATRTFEAALGLLDPYGAAVMTTCVVESFVPACLAGPSISLQARQLVAGYLSRRVGASAAWCHLARHLSPAEGPDLYYEGAGVTAADLLQRLFQLHRAPTPPEPVRSWQGSDEGLVVASAMGSMPGVIHQSPIVGAGLEEVPDGCDSLTPREGQVAQLVALGLTNDQVARRLGISRWTVVNHLRNIMRKLDCGTRVEVTRQVLQHRGDVVAVPA